MEKIKNLSIKKTMILYLCIALTLSFFTSAIVVSIADKIQYNIWFHYVDQDQYAKMQSKSEENNGFLVSVPRPGSYEMSERDRQISENCDFTETWTPLILSTLCSALAVAFFYRDKLKEPLRILQESSDKIAQSNLDFHVEYTSADEMGRLCSSFEHMRNQLEVNNKYLWKTIEEQKNLKAAIAHDIRAPLSVLQGYHEMLLEFIPQDRIDQEKLIEIIMASSGQVERLKNFVDSMKQLSSIEDREVNYGVISAVELKETLGETASLLNHNHKLELDIVLDSSVWDFFQADQAILLEVCENIITNAIRYAESKIIITLKVIENHLEIAIIDDGTGFQEEKMDLAVKAYYHDNPSDDLSHYGLGLYISKILCEKHGGMLLLSNQADGGACVKAVFEIKKTDKQKG